MYLQQNCTITANRHYLFVKYLFLKFSANIKNNEFLLKKKCCSYTNEYFLHWIKTILWCEKFAHLENNITITLPPVTPASLILRLTTRTISSFLYIYHKKQEKSIQHWISPSGHQSWNKYPTVALRVITFMHSFYHMHTC